MATIIKVSGADFSANAIGFLPPVARGLRYWNFFGGDATRNLAPGGQPSTLGANPVNGNGYVSLGGATLATAATVKTPYPETEAQTILLVGRATGDLSAQATRPYFAGNYNFSATPKGTGIFMSSATALTLQTSYTDPSTGSPLTTDNPMTLVNPASWKMVVALTDPGVRRALIDKTANTNRITASTAVRLLNTATTFQMGAAITNGIYGPSDLAFCALYNVALTDTEIEAVYQFVKTYLGKRGITV